MSLPARPRRFFLVLAVASSVLAVAATLFAGEPQWVEVRSPNFSVITDAGEKRGREVAMRFEQMRAVFGSLMTKGHVSLPVPLQIVAFRNAKELRQVAPLFNGKPIEVDGLFQQGNDRSFIMLNMSVENPWTVVFHEYAHQLMNGNLQSETAPWFEEGFAEYFSSIEVDTKEARVGKIPNDEYLILQQVGTMRIADLFSVQHNSTTYNESGSHRTTFYAESGMIMHFIYDNQLLPQVSKYFDLQMNQHLPVEDAIQKAFGMSSQQFDKSLRNYISSGHYKYYPIPTPASISAGNFTVTPLSAASGNAVVADIHLHSRDYQERALSEFQDVLKSDPNNGEACRGLGYAFLQKQDYAQAAEYFKRASQLDSKDPRVHYYNALLLARQSGFGPGADVSTMTRELETSLKLDPDFADSYALLAFAQSTAGDPATALLTMGKAVAMSPRNDDYRFNLANLYLANRQPGLAIALLRSLRSTASPELASRVTALLAQAEQFKMASQLQVRDNGDDEIVMPGPPPQKAISAEGAPTSAGTVKFLQGTLTSVDCSTAPDASLTVISGSTTWRMKVADRNHFVLIGADAFSCNWSRQKVAVNYRETAEHEGSVVSLEIQ